MSVLRNAQGHTEAAPLSCTQGPSLPAWAPGSPVWGRAHPQAREPSDTPQFAGLADDPAPICAPSSVLLSRSLKSPARVSLPSLTLGKLNTSYRHKIKSVGRGAASVSGLPRVCGPRLGQHRWEPAMQVPPGKGPGVAWAGCTAGCPQPHLSASSNTTYSTLCSFRFISTATCTKRPGVAMILEGGVQAGSPGATGRALLMLPGSWPPGRGPEAAILSPHSHVGVLMQGCKLVFHPREKRRCEPDRTGHFSPPPSVARCPGEAHPPPPGSEWGKAIAVTLGKGTAQRRLVSSNTQKDCYHKELPLGPRPCP